jgi:LCP family protein required for cell wall assembly
MNPRPNQLRSVIPKSRAIQLGIALLILLGSLLAGGSAFFVSRQITLASLGAVGGSNPQLEGSQSTNGQGQASDAVGGGNNPLAPEVEPELATWDGVGRVTLLLLGLDYRDWDAGEKYSRSDTMILLTLDPLARTAGILSIPRDMWVAIPGFQHGKINTAYYLGDAYKIPGGGPGLAVKTVENFLGVPINYYAQVDFGTFVKFIDEIGGVKVDVKESIVIDMLGSGSATKKKLQPGVQVLPGEWALAYARNRYTEKGDFDRAQRQQQVIFGIRDRILDFDLLPSLIAKAPALYNQLYSGIHTNLQLDEAVKLAQLASQIPQENIRSGVIGEKYVLFGRSPDDLSILIPLPDKIQVLRDEIFVTSGALSPLSPGSLEEQARAEQASVLVVDGSGSGQDGLVNDLRAAGIDATSGGTVDPVSGSRLILHIAKPHTLKYLADLLSVSESHIEIQYDPGKAADIEVIVGR